RVLTDFERQWGATFDGWRQHDGCAEAHGLTCDVDGMITSMRLASQGRSLGSIPVAIGNLTQLTQISITYCELAGSIPSILGSLTLLDALDLSSNNLSGSIPKSLQQLDRLRTLNLSSNRLSGPIPSPLLQRLTDLTLLDLSHNNQLSGSVPSSLASLSRLKFL
ncbi:unnamed protein product, partial [Closterium sp. Yama58-4]